MGRIGNWALVGLVAVACERDEQPPLTPPESLSEPNTPAPALAAEQRGSATEADAASSIPVNVPPLEFLADAEADFKSAPGQELEGEAELEAIPRGVVVRVDVDRGPKGTKAVHIHEKGDCSDIPGESMGGHFNPSNMPHGLPSEAKHHLGDLGNIEIDEDGDGKLKVFVPDANLTPGDPMSFLGRAVVIHMGKDVGVQPSGGAGKPMACAVIEDD